MKTPFKTRLKRTMLSLKKESLNACMIISAAPEMLRTRDQFYPYRQDSDFFYLTGSTEPSLNLFLSPGRKHPVLVAPVIDKLKTVWEGAPADYKAIAERIGAELIISKDIPGDLKRMIRGHDLLFHQNRAGSVSERIGRELQAIPSQSRGTLPSRFAHIDQILEEMRLIKDSYEIAAIKEACSITIQAIVGTASVIKNGIPERSVASTIDYWFGMLGGSPGFGTIAAAGRSAATLHYHRADQLLKNGDLFLLDCGAEYNMYNGDITRTFPVSGKFTSEQRDLYEIVLASQRAAIAKVKHGVLIKKVYDAAARILTEGLKDLKVLKGTTASLLEKGAYKPYFPHGIGHSLGIDVHDVGKHRGNNSATLREGMVFTIEPGLYFAKKTGNVPACGIRIEDDVLVKRHGCEVLTKDLPTDPDAIEVFLSE